MVLPRPGYGRQGRWRGRVLARSPSHLAPAAFATVDGNDTQSAPPPTSISGFDQAEERRPGSTEDRSRQGGRRHRADPMSAQRNARQLIDRSTAKGDINQ